MKKQTLIAAALLSLNLTACISLSYQGGSAENLITQTARQLSQAQARVQVDNIAHVSHRNIMLDGNKPYVEVTITTTDNMVYIGNIQARRFSAPSLAKLHTMKSATLLVVIPNGEKLASFTEMDNVKFK